jgi:hypothetical protein
MPLLLPIVVLIVLRTRGSRFKIEFRIYHLPRTVKRSMAPSTHSC